MTSSSEPKEQGHVTGLRGALGGLATGMPAEFLSESPSPMLNWVAQAPRN